jgi:hypothetical protein
MSPDFRRVALIAAALGLLVSLFIVLSRDDDEPAAPTTTVATTTAPPATTETAPATTTAAPPPSNEVTIRIVVGSDGVEAVRRFSVKQGRKVTLIVRSELADHVHLHGYDLMADVAPGTPGTIEFTADAPGRFEIELEDRRLPIAELEVRP